MSKPSECGSVADLQPMILDRITDALIAIDSNGRIVYWNRGAEHLCHLSACDVLGKHPKDLRLSPWFSAEEEEAVFSAMEREGVWRREGVRSNGNGHTMHLESLITALIGPDGEWVGLLVVMHDITSAKRKEHDQEQRIETLRGASDRLRLLEGLIPICSHCKQIRDPSGSWHEPDAYLRGQFHVKFTHGICPVCAEKHHPECFSRRPTAP